VAGELENVTMRKLTLSLGIAAAVASLAQIAFAPLLLTEAADQATTLLLGAGLFTIAIAAVVHK
jgi:hypothetical protein